MSEECAGIKSSFEQGGFDRTYRVAFVYQAFDGKAVGLKCAKREIANQTIINQRETAISTSAVIRQRNDALQTPQWLANG